MYYDVHKIINPFLEFFAEKLNFILGLAYSPKGMMNYTLGTRGFPVPFLYWTSWIDLPPGFEQSLWRNWPGFLVQKVAEIEPARLLANVHVWIKHTISLDIFELCVGRAFVWLMYEHKQKPLDSRVLSRKQYRYIINRLLALQAWPESKILRQHWRMSWRRSFLRSTSCLINSVGT